MNLSNHFTLEELIDSESARTLNIDNTPSPDEIENLRALCVNVLEPIRVEFDRPVVINSGFRCARLNIAIGGVSSGQKTSQHVLGQAADIVIPGIPVQLLFDRIKNGNFVKGFDQLIQEFNRWVHVSFAAGRNRNQALMAYKLDGKSHYEEV